MKGLTVARTLAIVMMVVTAHIIKPFSMDNVGSYIFYTSRSFASILPEPARETFHQANFLAMTLSDGLLREKEGDIVAPDADSKVIERVIARGAGAEQKPVKPSDIKNSVRPSRKMEAGPITAEAEVALETASTGEQVPVEAAESTFADAANAVDQNEHAGAGPAFWGWAAPGESNPGSWSLGLRTGMAGLQQVRYESLNLEPLINQTLSVPAKSFCNRIDQDSVRLVAVERAIRVRAVATVGPAPLAPPALLAPEAAGSQSPTCDEQSIEQPVDTEREPATPALNIRIRRPLGPVENCY